MVLARGVCVVIVMASLSGRWANACHGLFGRFSPATEELTMAPSFELEGNQSPGRHIEAGLLFGETGWLSYFCAGRCRYALSLGHCPRNWMTYNDRALKMRFSL